MIGIIGGGVGVGVDVGTVVVFLACAGGGVVLACGGASIDSGSGFESGVGVDDIVDVTLSVRFDVVAAVAMDGSSSEAVVVGGVEVDEFMIL